jgi:hypothetical protein
MRKCVLLIATFLFFSSCEKPDLTADNHPDNEDTITESAMAPLDEMPVADSIDVSASPKEALFSCKRDTGIINFLAGLCTVPQHFVIDPANPSEITGQSGTRVFFNPGCFVSKNKKPVISPVDIKMKECYSLNSMLFENLSTAYGNRSFQSKGALYMEATCNGQPVEMKDGESAYVELPVDAGEKDGYQVYFAPVANSESTGWMPLPYGESDYVDRPVQAEGSFTKPEFHFRNLDFLTYLHQMLNYPDEARHNELSAKVEVSFSVDTNGKVGNISAGESFKTFQDEITSVLGEMPGWKPATYQGASVPAIINMNIDFNIRRNDEIKIEYDPNSAGLIHSSAQCYVESGNAEFDSPSRNQTAFPISNMGWYCSMKNASHKTGEAEVIVPDDAKTEVKLVMKNKFSVLLAQNCMGYSRFNSLPLGSEVYVVGLKYDRGTSFYAVKEVKLSKQNIVSLDWQKADKCEIKRAVEDI